MRVSGMRSPSTRSSNIYSFPGTILHCEIAYPKERVSLMDHSKYNPDRFKRKSIRLPGRDYAAKSAYFITIRSDQHQTLFEIPELRNILQETWKGLPKRFPSVSLDEFVIMPDHIHFILWLK